MSHAQLHRRLATWLCDYGDKLGPHAFYAGPHVDRMRRRDKMLAALDYRLHHDANAQKRARHAKRPNGRGKGR